MPEGTHVRKVSPKLRQTIVEGKDINLSVLLMLPAIHSLGYHGDKEKEKPDPKLMKQLTIGEFITAFGIYKGLLS